MMINTAYDMMDNINDLVEKNEDILSEEEREILRVNDVNHIKLLLF